MSFRNTDISTVEYQILFTKRDLEAVLEKRTQVVTKSLSNSGFVSWKIAEFIGKLSTNSIPKPPNWTASDAHSIGIYDPATNELSGINASELDNLEVQYQILEVAPRKQANYEKDNVTALENIARKLPSQCGNGKKPKQEKTAKTKRSKTKASKAKKTATGRSTNWNVS